MKKAEAAAILAKLGLELDPDSGQMPDGIGRWACIDAKGRSGFSGDCRGHVVYDFTSSASAFWQEVADLGRTIAGYVTACPLPEGECEFHDEGESE